MKKEERPLIIALEHRFLCDKYGNIFTNSVFDYAFWNNYLEVFKEVFILARVKQVEYVPSRYLQSNGQNVSFIKLPYYIGPSEFLKKLIKIIIILWGNLNTDAIYILRVPGTVSSILWLMLEIKGKLKKKKIIYALEVLGDPDGVFSKGSVKHPLRPFFRVLFSNLMKIQCKKAIGVSYVTKDALQRKYPCKGKEFYISSVNLKCEEYVKVPRKYKDNKDIYNLILVGSLEQLYKGVDILLDSVKICLDNGYKIKLFIVGEGKYKEDLKSKAKDMKIEDNVRFVGHISDRARLLKYLDDADLFVLPSRTEGLPGAMIEAMARGLPCIGTKVGGIPELLEEEDLVPPNDSISLAKKIQEVITDNERMSKMSERNLKRAREFSYEILSRKRNEFCMYISEAMDKCLNMCEKQVYQGEKYYS